MPEGGPKYDFATIKPPGTEPKVTSIFDFTAEALEQLAFWLEQRGLRTPISQVLGYQQTTPNSDLVNAQESTTTDAFVDLTTAGPSLSGLSDGKYVAMYGADARNQTSGKDALLTLYANGAEASSGGRARAGGSTEFISIAKASQLTLSSAGNNTLTLKYARDGDSGTAEFQNRWLVAIKYANA